MLYCAPYLLFLTWQMQGGGTTVRQNESGLSMEGSCADRLHIRKDDAKPALRHFPDPSALCMKQKTRSLQSMPKMADDADVVWRILESALLANIGKRSVDPDHDHLTTAGSGTSPP